MRPSTEFGLSPAMTFFLQGITEDEQRWLRRKTMLQAQDALRHPPQREREVTEARFWISAAMLLMATDFGAKES